MSWIKKISGVFGYLIFLGLAVAILLEVTFRVLPTTSPVDLQRIDSEDEILSFEKNQTGTFSLGANFYKTVDKKTNNAGFYSNYIYEKDAFPDIMVIGDSYVEAAQIQNIDSVGELLQADGGAGVVYQMGVSGVPISQYIKMAAYAKKHYSPKRYVIVLVGNDFDESLCDYRVKEGTWCFDKNFNLVFVPFHGYKGIRGFARQSAFVRYLVFQVGINWHHLMSLARLNDEGMSAGHNFAGNVERHKEQALITDSINVINRFMEALKELEINDKVTLVLDADRQDIYNGQESKSYFRQMRNYTIRSAKLNNVELIDMEPIFKDDYSRHKQRFEFSTDGHWNERAHKLLAEALLRD